MEIENRNSRQYSVRRIYDLQRDVFAAGDPFHANFLVARNHPAERLAIFKYHVSSYSECDRGVCAYNVF